MNPQQPNNKKSFLFQPDESIDRYAEKMQAVADLVMEGATFEVFVEGESVLKNATATTFMFLAATEKGGFETKAVELRVEDKAS